MDIKEAHEISQSVTPKTLEILPREIREQLLPYLYQKDGLIEKLAQELCCELAQRENRKHTDYI